MPLNSNFSQTFQLVYLFVYIIISADQSQLNSTYTKPADTTVQSYDITPARHELPPEPLNPQVSISFG